MIKPKSGLQTSNLTYQQKREIVKYVATNEYKISQENLVKWAKCTFNLACEPDSTTIGRILRNKQKFLTLSSQDQSLRRSRVIQFSTLKTALAN